MGLIYNKNKPGKGVEKENENLRPHVRFLKIFYRKTWELTKLNLLYLMFILPTFLAVFFLSGIITSDVSRGTTNPNSVLYEITIRIVISSFFTVFWGMGPATSGLTKVLMKYVREEHSFVLSEFIGAIKENFKQSLYIYIIDLAAFVVLYAGLLFYGNISGIAGLILTILIISIILVYTMMHFYIYPIMITYDLKLKYIYRNSLIYTIGKLPRTLLTLIILLAIHIGTVYVIMNFSIGVLLMLLGTSILYALSGFIVNFSVYENMKKIN